MQVKNVNIGDVVARSGIYTEPGVVVERKANGSVVVDTEPLMVNKYHRYTNTTGLSEVEKDQFNTILDQIYQKTNDVERINDIQQEVDKLRANPENQNVVRYLRNQQAFLVRQAKGLPRMYQADETAVKG
ncbi:MAG: hypothetical protein NTV34_18290 [Proteobacteria bacterium]|nr:hypothetical protein [Pseudomonadota bacterium]